MKKINLILIGLLVFSSISVSGQIGVLNGSNFEFKNGFEDWSEPLSIDVTTKKGDNSVPVTIRLKYDKKVLFACQYFVEITNLSDSKSLKFDLGTTYKGSNNKRIFTKFDLKPNQTKTEKLLYGEYKKILARGIPIPPNGVEDCVCKWKPELEFVKPQTK